MTTPKQNAERNEMNSKGAMLQCYPSFFFRITFLAKNGLKMSDIVNDNEHHFYLNLESKI